MSKSKQKTTVADEVDTVVIRLSDLGIFETTPEQVDLQIQVERILHILDDTIEKLRVSACLPAFLKNNACWLRKHCDADDVDYIQNACLKYTSLDYSPNMKNTNVVERMSVVINKIKANEPIRFAKTLDTMVDPRMAHVLELLWNNNAIKEKLLQDYNMLVDENAKTLISCVRNLRRIAQKTLPQTASEQRSRERYLRNTWAENQKMQEEINGLKKDIENQKQYFQSHIDNKKRLFLESQNKMNMLIKNFKTNVKETANDSEKIMVRKNEENNSALEILQIDAKRCVQQYEGLLAEHMLIEKKLRTKRLKTKTQLMSFLNKFDDDMGERQKQYDEIKAAYDADKIEMAKLQNLFEIQEKEYLIVMKEKTEEEQRQLELKVQSLIQSHAARIIQRYWRLYRIRKLERPKQKRSKGKRK